MSIALLIINHSYFFYGYFGYDDMHYSKLSSWILDGRMDYSDHYSYRWTILGFTALSYAILGVTDFSTALPSLLISATILLTFYYRYLDDSFSLMIALLLFFSVKWLVFYTDKLMPDIYVSCFLFVAWCIYQSRNKNYSIRLQGILFAFSLFLAFLSKGTVIIIVPLLIFYFYSDLRKSDRVIWRWSLLTGGVLLIIYFATIYLMTGDIFARFSAIKSNEYFNSCSYNLMPVSQTWDRITHEFVQFVWRENLLVFLLIPIVSLIYAHINRFEEDRIRTINYYFWTIVILFLSMNFMTISMSSYNPGCLDVRHYLFMFPIMSASCVSILEILQLKRKFKSIVFILLLFGLIPTGRLMQYSKSIEYSIHKQDYISLSSDLSQKNIVIVSNQVMINLINFYSAFRKEDYLYTPKTLMPNYVLEESYLVSNWYSEFHASVALESLKNDLYNGGYILSDSLCHFNGQQLLQCLRIYENPKCDE
jgi:hypothetical protein